MEALEFKYEACDVYENQRHKNNFFTCDNKPFNYLLS